jgi:hypothetical protein
VNAPKDPCVLSGARSERERGFCSLAKSKPPDDFKILLISPNLDYAIFETEIVSSVGDEKGGLQ